MHDAMVDGIMTLFSNDYCVEDDCCFDFNSFDGNYGILRGSVTKKFNQIGWQIS
jgi:hypothetical protein